ncbi:hypothetical protein [Citrobacter amalonaticus]|uniref:hypothetical protein n=1 Tax=Citrobacter amalonaticus TaxID=35703 RepID=UPI00300CCBF9
MSWKKNISCIPYKKREAGDRVDMSWGQVLIYVWINKRSYNDRMTWQEGLSGSGSALGFDVTVRYFNDELFLSLVRDGIEIHTFTGGLAINGAFEFLAGVLHFNASYYPSEIITWHQKDLDALCYGENHIRNFHYETFRQFDGGGELM